MDKGLYNWTQFDSLHLIKIKNKIKLEHQIDITWFFLSKKFNKVDMSWVYTFSFKNSPHGCLYSLCDLSRDFLFGDFRYLVEPTSLPFIKVFVVIFHEIFAATMEAESVNFQ